MTAESEPAPKTRLAFLSTIGDLHTTTLQYDLTCLRTLITQISPDLLCAEISRTAWEGNSLSGVPLEVREALIPVVLASDIVLIPVAPNQPTNPGLLPEWRKSLVRTFDRVLQWGQRQANGPEGIHSLTFETFCHSVCALTEISWTGFERTAWKEENEALAANIIQAVRRDPGCRVLVVVQCQRVHTLEPILKRHWDLIKLVRYKDL
ncbi:MAG: hypothetical protein H6654_09510 [Ardenticatenaceae bacterium]|nr:hypothetical protein [Anaerolineales bacterium]MCB8973782.1 hypothetical protein [Ardenticatenaceae bacterium]